MLSLRKKLKKFRPLRNNVLQRKVNKIIENYSNGYSNKIKLIKYKL